MQTVSFPTTFLHHLREFTYHGVYVVFNQVAELSPIMMAKLKIVASSVLNCLLSALTSLFSFVTAKTIMGLYAGYIRKQQQWIFELRNDKICSTVSTTFKSKERRGIVAFTRQGYQLYWILRDGNE